MNFVCVKLALVSTDTINVHKKTKSDHKWSLYAGETHYDTVVNYNMFQLDLDLSE